MHIDVISVPVTDQERAKTFYQDVLGFELVRDNSFGEGDHQMRWVQLKPPGAQTDITLVNWFDAMPPGALQGLVLHVDDIDAAHADLAGKGLEIGKIDPQPWGRFAAFKDPDGNGWVLMGDAER